jgi:phosphatidylglycerol:prolipoprotein diacylglycerol transferase
MTTPWVHNLDPFLIRISGNFGIRWYSMAYLAGFACAFAFMTWMAKKKRTPLTVDGASDFLTYLIVGVLAGGRLGYVFFYSPDLLTDFRHSFPFWGALAVWEGGMASHGGFIGVILACLIYAWKHKIDPLHLGDMTFFGATTGIFLGRIANFINGELMGRIAPADLPWAVKFPQDMYRWIGWEPQNLPRMLPLAREMGVSESEFTSWIQHGERGRMDDLVTRAIERIQNGDKALTDVVAQFLDPRHPSQLYAALVEGLIPFIVLAIVWRKPRKAGLIGSLYLIMYSCSRIVDEMFRLPDAQLSDLSQLPLGLTRGQFLSLFMFIGAIGLTIWTLRRQGAKYGGLLEGGPAPEPEDEKKRPRKR